MLQKLLLEEPHNLFVRGKTRVQREIRADEAAC
jgi:hypothetical protein